MLPRGWLPPSGVARLLCAQTLIWSLGSGLFLAGEIVYFTRYIGLSGADVSKGLAIAASAGVVLGLPLGLLVDLMGARRVWSITAFVEATSFIGYLLVDSWFGFLLVVSVLTLAASAGGSARNAYTYNVLEGEARVQTLAYVRSVLNIGFVLGGSIAGVILLMPGRSALAALPTGAAIFFLVNAVFIARLPAVPVSDSASPARSPNPLRSPALRNGRFVLTSFASGWLATVETLMNVTFPLWVLSRTSAPQGLIGAMFVISTVLVILLQVRASQGVDNIPAAISALWRGARLLVLACVVMAASVTTRVTFVQIVLIALAYILATGAELFVSPAEWTLLGELSTASARAQYSSVWSLGNQVARLIALPMYAWLVLDHGAGGWLVISVLLGLSALATAKSARHRQSAD